MLLLVSYGVGFLSKKTVITKNTFDSIEVNILSEDKILHSQTIDTENDTFILEKFEYHLDMKKVFLYPSKNGFFPVLFYKNKNKEPLEFKNKNKGIPSRALHLLWNHRLYKVLVELENDKTNLIIIILLIANIVAFGIRMYLLYKGV